MQAVQADNETKRNFYSRKPPFLELNEFLPHENYPLYCNNPDGFIIRLRILTEKHVKKLCKNSASTVHIQLCTVMLCTVSP